MQAKQTPCPAAELDLGTLRLDPTVAGTGLRAAVAQVRLLERRPSSRPATPTSNASSTDTPTPSEHNDVEEDLLDVEDEAQGSEPESGPSTLKRPFDLLIAAAMQRNPTQFQLPNDLTCTTALPGMTHEGPVLFPLGTRGPSFIEKPHKFVRDYLVFTLSVNITNYMHAVCAIFIVLILPENIVGFYPMLNTQLASLTMLLLCYDV